MSQLEQFIEHLDDEAYYGKCVEVIENAIKCGTEKVFLDLDWWKRGMKALGTNPMTSFILFNPENGLLADRASSVLTRCAKHFSSSYSLRFWGVDGGSMCVLSKK